MDPTTIAATTQPLSGQLNQLLPFAQQSLARALTANDTRNQNAGRRLQEIYDGDPRAALKEHLAALFPAASAIYNAGDLEWHRYLNLPRMFASTLGVVFQEPPRITLTDAMGEPLPPTDARLAQWEADCRAIGLAVALQDIEACVVLHRACLVGVEMVRGEPRWRPNAPFRVVIDWDPVEPERIEKARGIHVGIPERLPAVGQVTAEPLPVRWSSWLYNEETGEWSHVLLRGTSPNGADALQRPALFAGAVNDYGCHPFALWATMRPPTGLPLPPPRWDWLRLSNWIGAQLIQHARAIVFQAASVAVMRGSWDEPEPIIEPGRIQKTSDPNSRLEFVTPEIGRAHV